MPTDRIRSLLVGVIVGMVLGLALIIGFTVVWRLNVYEQFVIERYGGK